VLGALPARMFIFTRLFTREKINNYPLMAVCVEHANILSHINPKPNPNLNPNHEKIML